MASDGPHDERLQQTPVGVAPNDARGQEDGEDGAEEEGGEHGQPEDGRAGQRRRVDADLGCLERVDLLEGTIGAERVEDEEPRREQHDHGSTRLRSASRKRVAGDDDGAAHALSPPTTSR